MFTNRFIGNKIVKNIYILEVSLHTNVMHRVLLKFCWFSRNMRMLIFEDIAVIIFGVVKIIILLIISVLQPVNLIRNVMRYKYVVRWNIPNT